MAKKISKIPAKSSNWLIYVCLALIIVIALLFTFYASHIHNNLSEDPNLAKLSDISTKLAAGNEKYQNRDFSGAISTYKSIIQLESDNSFAWTNLGNAYRELQDYSNAILAHEMAVSLTPDRARTQYNLGVSYQCNGQYNDAILQYENTIKLDPKHINAYYNMGLSYQDSGDTVRAMLSYRSALVIDQYHVQSRLNICNMILFQDKLREAERCFMDVLSIDPTYSRAMVNLASLYHTSSDYVQAKRWYSEALKVDGSNAIARHAMAALSDTPDVSEKSDTSATYTMSKQYVRELFDSYAASFEQSLEKLQYRSPELLTDRLRSYLFNSTKTGESSIGSCDTASCMQRAAGVRVLDLGCGTGLLCPLLRKASLVSAVVGVDLSSKMTQKAKSKNCYETVHVDDVEAFLLQTEDTQFDIIAATDVFVYFSALDSVLTAARRVFTSGELDTDTTNAMATKDTARQLLIFTVESLDAYSSQSEAEEEMPTEMGVGDRERVAANDIPYKLLPSGRYAHSARYLRSVASETGYDIILFERCVPRLDKGTPVQGYLLFLTLVSSQQ